MASTIKRKINEGITQVKNAASFIITDVTSHWSKPGKGNYVSYKEILNYSIGGMGQNMLIYLLGYMALGVTNTLFASTIGIRPMHLQNMLAVQTILNIVFQIIRGKIVDNTNTRWGRFRPYLAIMGAPLAIISVIFVFLPFESMSYSDKYTAVFVFAIAISIGQPLYQTAYTNLGSVISPSTAERSKVLAISSLIYSFAPTVYQLFVPIFSNLTGGFTDIRTYKFIVVPIGILGVFLSFFAFFGCKERIVSSKHFVKKVSIIGGCVAVWRNKYWWLRTVSTWFNFLEGAYLVLFGWIYIYGTQDMNVYGILQTVLSIASGLSMFATPFFLKWLGNKGILLFHNVLNIVFIACMLACYEIPLLYFLFLWINTFINQLQLVYNPVLNAEVKDSIQWQSGKRVDYMLEVAALIGTPVTILTGYFLPYIYESYGLTVNYDVLYDPSVRNSLFYMLCALSILGAALNLAPYFLYNLSREKHSMIVLALKYRAANTDYRTGDLTPHQVKDLVESYNYMVERRDAAQPDIKEKKEEMKAAKAVFKTAQKEYEALYERIEKDTPKGEEVVKTDELLALEEIYHQQKQAYKDARLQRRVQTQTRQRGYRGIHRSRDRQVGHPQDAGQAGAVPRDHCDRQERRRLHCPRPVGRSSPRSDRVDEDACRKEACRHAGQTRQAQRKQWRSFRARTYAKVVNRGRLASRNARMGAKESGKADQVARGADQAHRDALQDHAKAVKSLLPQGA